MSGRIDVHHHILPPHYVGALAGLGITGGGGIPFPAWSMDHALEMMDRQGAEAAVTSVSAPGVHFGDAAFARDLARRCNETSAALVAAAPARFGAFATLPLPDVGAALVELEHALDVLGLDGVVLLASQSDGRYLGDQKFDELLAELDRRAAVVFVHPTIPKSSETLPIDVPGFATEFTFDTSRAVANLVWCGAMHRFPNIRYILSHAGGTTPFLAWRWSLLDHHPTLGAEFAQREPAGFLNSLRRFHYDTALSANPFALRSLCELVGPAQILFGSDFPFAPEILTAVSIQGLESYEGLDEAALRRISRENALDLLPSLRARLA
jgi:predicted TIM-barrel fold metal-dependent hydrolase